LKALVVDDDRNLADLLAFTLRRERYEVVQAYDGPSALKRFTEERPDIVILDVNLDASPRKIDGFEVCRQIRSESDIPVILLTVRSGEDDIVRGLKIGADDYILKPFSPRQLVARVEAVLRRAGASAAPSELVEGEITLDPSRREVVIHGGKPVSLTGLETRLLSVLMINAGQVLAFDDLIAHVWGPGGGDRDMLRQLVRRLRSKIEPDPANPIYIETIAGMGYGFIRPRGDQTAGEDRSANLR
jgi:DNA-binding response OmpR family regulator